MEIQKNICFCFIDYTKPINCVDHNKLWKILKKMGLPVHLTCLLRNLYEGQKAAVRTKYDTMDWVQNWERVWQGCMLSPCLFNVYAEYIMWNARLDEAQAGIKIARWNINNFRHTDDTALMAVHKEELKSLLMRVRKSEKADLKFNIQKRSWHTAPSRHGTQKRGGRSGRGRLLGLQDRCTRRLQPWDQEAPRSLQTVTAAMRLRGACSLEEKLWGT